MKSRQLNKLYQMMRVSRFYYRHKAKTASAPMAKQVIKTYNDKLDDLLVNVLKQKEDIKYAAREINLLREELTQAALYTCRLSGLYLMENNTSSSSTAYFSINKSYTDLKSLRNIDFSTRTSIMLEIVKKHAKETKPYGVKEKDIAKFEELKNQWEKTYKLPWSLLKDRRRTTEKVFEGLNELNVMQREKLDKIADCFMESKGLKTEYRKARKYVKYKNPEGMFDAMLRWYRGMNRKKVGVKKKMQNEEMRMVSEA